MNERSILCFGDSNTWGFVPRPSTEAPTFKRYDHLTRWPRRLEQLLGPGFRVHEHGICGLAGGLASGADRFEDGTSRAAIDHVQGLVASCCPLDDWVVMLGTNDLAHPAQYTPAGIAAGIETTILAGIAAHALFAPETPTVWLVSPIPLGTAVLASGIDGSTLERSYSLAAALDHVASRNGWRSIDAALAGPLDAGDGVHWSAGHHERFAELLAPLLRQT